MNNNTISLRQFQMLLWIQCFGMGVVFLPQSLYADATLLSVIVDWGVCLLFGVIVTYLACKMRGMITSHGPLSFVAKLIFCVKSVIGLAVFICIFSEIISNTILPSTPTRVIFLTILTLGALSAVCGLRLGSDQLARSAALLFYAIFAPFVLLFIFGISDMRTANLMPLRLISYSQSSPYMPLGIGFNRYGVLALFMFFWSDTLIVTSALTNRPEKSPKAAVTATLGIGVFMGLLLVGVLARYGRIAYRLQWPILEMMNNIRLPGGFVERTEALMAAFWIMSAFIIIAAGLLLPLRLLLKSDGERKPAAAWIAVIIVSFVVYAVSTMFKNAQAAVDFCTGWFFVFTIAAQLLLPLLSGYAKPTTRKHASSGVAMLCVVCISCALLTGCYDGVYPEGRGFVISVGLDLTDNGEYEISLALPNAAATAKQSGDEETKSVKKASGKTFTDALTKCEALTSQRLFLGQSKLIVFGKELLADADKLREAVRELKRNKRIYDHVIVCAADGKASEILESKAPGESTVGLYINEYYKDKNNGAGKTFRKDFEGVAEDLSENGETILPVINDKLEFDGAVIVKDFKTVGTLKDEALRGYLWARYNQRGAVIETVGSADYSNAIEVTRSKTVYVFAEQDGLSISIRTTIHTKSDIPELDPREHEKAVAKEILTTAGLLKEYNADALLLADELRRQNYELYQKYADDKEALSAAIASADISAEVTIY